MNEFRILHQQQEPLLICNVWDVPSARTAEKLRFQAIGTSSAAIAKMLGYNDGEEMTFYELEYMIRRIAASTDLPLTVDMEAGYGHSSLEIIENVKRLTDLGVVGINIEDTVVSEKREFLQPEEFAKTIELIKKRLIDDGLDVFLNVRTDAFLLKSPNPLQEALKRIPLYDKAGADGIFVPGIVQDEDIKTVVESTSLPVNVMCMPGLSNFIRLQELGVKRISMGNFLHDNINSQLEKRLESIKNQKSFKPIFQ